MKKISNYPLTFSAPAETAGEQSEGVVLAAEQGVMSNASVSGTIPLSSGQSSVIQSVECPVLYSLGLAELTIPLYTVKQGDLEVPITLSYQGSGIKVDEIASPVGLGWTLNAGGSVVRQINGSIDSTPSNGVIWPIDTSSAEGVGGVTLNRLYYDKYYYNYPGGGGHFIVGQNAFNNDKIEYFAMDDDVARFTIKSPYGVTYDYSTSDSIIAYDFYLIPVDIVPVECSGLFFDKDTYKSKNIGWRVSKITSADGCNSISFRYSSMGRVTKDNTNLSCFYRKPVTMNDDDRFVSVDTSRIINRSGVCYQDCSVSEINFNDNKVVFTYTDAPVDSENPIRLPVGMREFSDPNPKRRLSEIKVVNCNNEVIRRIVFENRENQYDILRYRLNRIKFYDGEDKLFDQYDFTYYNLLYHPVDSYTITPDNPPKQPSAYAQDHFGYYNGADDNTDLHFVNLYDDEFDRSQKRAYSFEHAKIDSLKTIKRLSGSKTEFIYEPNVHNDQRVGNINIGIRIKEINEYDENLAVKSRKFRYEQSGTTIDFSKIDLSFFLNRGQRGNKLNDMVYEQLRFTSYSHLPGVPIESARVFYGKVTEDITDCVKNKMIRTEYYYHTTGWAYEYVPHSYEKLDRSPDDAGKCIDIQDYVYSVPSDPSTGKRRYVGEIRGYFKERTAAFDALSKQVVYENIDVNTFRAVEELRYTYTQFNRKQICIGSYVKSMKTFIEETYSSTKVSNADVGQQISTGNLQMSAVLSNSMDSLPGDHYSFDVYQDVYLSKPTSVTTIKHYGYSTKSETVEYKYNHSAPYMYSGWPCTPDPNETIPDELNLTTLQLKETFARKGLDNYKHRYLYPDNYEGSILRLMKYANNLYTCVGEEVIKNGTEVTANYTDYKRIDRYDSAGKYNPLYKPAKKITCLNGETISETTYEEYDSYGNPVYVKSTGAPDTCYVWSYKGMYPVAEIKNVTYTALKEKLGGDSALKAIEKATSHTAFINTLNALRGTLPDALITTYTYKPLVGITSITDPAGRIQTLHYDSAGRLAAVKDDVGSILESYEYAVKNS